jgi:hypothetical protein
VEELVGSGQLRVAKNGRTSGESRGEDDLKLLMTENWRLRVAVISHGGTEAQRREFSVGSGLLVESLSI